MPRIYNAGDNVLLLEDSEKYKPHNLNGWMMSEKLDGERAVWNGEFFETRNGKKIAFPDYYKDIMPNDVALDGELWLGRNSFDDHGFLRNKVCNYNKWRGARFMIFDIPTSKDPFSERYKQIKKAIKKISKKFDNLDYKNIDLLPDECPAIRHRHKKIKNNSNVDELFKKVVAKGGEGLVLRKMDAPYEPKRCRHSLKIKPKPETEAIIIGYQEGANKNVGKLGAFVLHPLVKSDSLSDKQINFDIQFEVGTGLSDIDRNNVKFKNGKGSSKEYPIGTIITFRYQEYTKNGKPRFPSFLRKREDMTINDDDLSKIKKKYT